MTRKLIIAVTASLFALTVSACNTVHGAGEDLQSASDEVEKKI